MSALLDRINELAHKQKEEGLTDEEIAEQVKLRAEFIARFRKNLKSQLDQIDVLEPDGTVTHLKDTYKENRRSES